MQETFRITPTDSLLNSMPFSRSTVHSFTSSSNKSPPSIITKWQASLSGNLLALAFNNSNTQSTSSSTSDPSDIVKSHLKLVGRTGNITQDLPFNQYIWDVEWCPADNSLAVLQENGKIFLFNPLNGGGGSGRSQTVDSGWKGCTILRWSPADLVLAVGSLKGNVLIVNKSIGKKIPILAKHSKAISNMLWTPANELVLVSEDKTFSVCSVAGDTLFHGNVGGVPSHLSYFERVVPEASSRRVIAMVVGSGKIVVVALDKHNEAPLEMKLDQKYGSVSSLNWHGADQVLLTFDSGIISSISTSLAPGKEIIHIKDQGFEIRDVAVNRSSNSLSLISKTGMKVRDLNDPRTVSSIINFDDSYGVASSVAYSTDGHFVCVGSQIGSVFVLLDQVPLLTDTSRTKIATLTALSTISLYDVMESTAFQSPQLKTVNRNSMLNCDVNMEPSVLAVSTQYFAVGCDNEVEVYSHDTTSKEYNLVASFEVPSDINSLAVTNSHVVVLCSGKVYVRDLQNDENRPIHTDENYRSVYASGRFIVAVSKNSITHFVLPSGDQANVYTHECFIDVVFPDPRGVEVAFIDSKKRAYILNPLRENTIQVPLPSENVQSLLWDADSLNFAKTISCFDGERLHAFRIHTGVLTEDPLELISEVVFTNSGYTPVTVAKGNVFCVTKNRLLVHILLEPYSLPNYEMDRVIKYYKAGGFGESLSESELEQFDTAVLQELGLTALQHLDLEIAMQVYRKLGVTDHYFAIEECIRETNLNFVKGKISVLLQSYDKAQEYFLLSDKPVEALNLRMDLLQWDKALFLADKVDAKLIPHISYEYARQLESQSNFRESLRFYKQALESLTDGAEKSAAESGYIRSSLRIGDLSTAMKLAVRIENPQSLSEFADILDSMKQYHEAALLYEKAGIFEKAAGLYGRIKNFAKMGQFLHLITSPKLHALYGKHKESAGEYEAALKSYDIAGDIESQCRLYIQLKQPNTAVKLARESKSKAAAKVVLKFFQDVQDPKAMVEFCLLAGLEDEAFAQARTHGLMEYYASLIETGASPEILQSLATYFEQQGELMLAAKYCTKCGLYDRAAQIIIKAPRTKETLDVAVDLVGEAKTDSVTAIVLQYLTSSENDMAIVYLMKLYLSLERYDEAVTAALHHAKIEIAAGSYKRCREDLAFCYTRLLTNKRKIPLELHEMLIVVHSYMLVKILVKLERHDNAARLLLRVCAKIDLFTTHMIPILTTGVIECHRANLKKSAFRLAAILCKPENRQRIDDKFKKKIELTVRRPETREDTERLSLCPQCSSDIPESDGKCGVCKSVLPVCIATGLHVKPDAWTECPECHFPANIRDLKAVLEHTNACPFCGKHVDPSQLELVSPERQAEYLQLLQPQQ